MKHLIRFTALAVLITLPLTTPAWAGSDRVDSSKPTTLTTAQAEAFADKINTALDARKVNVALVARAGRSREDLPEGIEFTHVGIAIFEPVQVGEDEIYYTYTVYNLYHNIDGDPARSGLVQDFMVDMAAGAVEPEIGVIVPCEALQQRLMDTVRSPIYTKLHNPDYNLIANPYNDRFDNCVTHTLKVLFAAIYNTDDPDRIQANINAYFKAHEVDVPFVKRFGAGFISAVSFADQGMQAKTATFGSLRRFLEQENLLKEYFEVPLEGDV